LHTGGITESSPVLGDDGTIYICINDFRSALTPDGKVKFENFSSVIMDATPAVAADGRSFFAAEDWNLTGLRLDNNRLAWWHVYLKSSILTSPLIAPDGNIYVVTWFAGLAAVKADTTLATSAWPMFRANFRHTGVVNAPSH